MDEEEIPVRRQHCGVAVELSIDVHLDVGGSRRLGEMEGNANLSTVAGGADSGGMEDLSHEDGGIEHLPVCAGCRGHGEGRWRTARSCGGSGGHVEGNFFLSVTL